MMVWSFKLNKKALLLVLGAIIAVIVIVLIAVNGGGSAQNPDIDNSASTPEERLDFISQFGWEVNPEPAESINIYIPKDFDAILQRYNAIQTRQGYDLTAHKGKKVERFSYEITNYPNQNTDVFINLLIYDGKVIGGDVSSKNLGGFMHGFSPDRLTLSSEQTSSSVTSENLEEIPSAPTAASANDIYPTN